MKWEDVKSILSYSLLSLAIGIIYNIFFIESDITSFEEKDWKQHNYFGITFEAPFELSKTELDLPPTVESLVKKMDTYYYDSKPVSLFLSKTESHSRNFTDIDGATEEAMRSMKTSEGVSEFIYDVQPINKNHLEGRRITGNFTLKNKEAEFVVEVYSNKSKLLQIMLTNMKYSKNQEVRDRILKSFKLSL